jgi:acyl-CoA thioesterase-2
VGEGHGVVFGGQLLAQSIVAAARGHDTKRVKTVHTVFARGGSSETRLDIAVQPVASGRSIASSSVTISQGGRIITQSLVLMSAEEPDLISYADPAPAVPPAGNSPGGQGADGWQVQVVGGVDINDPEAVGPPELDVWSRFAGAPEDPLINQALLSYATDGFLIGTAMRPHPGVGQAQAHQTLSTGVLSHTLTFHQPFSAGRSYGRADVFGADGRLVASFVQDNMIRAKAGGPGPL